MRAAIRLLAIGVPHPVHRSYPVTVKKLVALSILVLFPEVMS